LDACSSDQRTFDLSFVDGTKPLHVQSGSLQAYVAAASDQRKCEQMQPRTACAPRTANMRKLSKNSRLTEAFSEAF